MFNEALGALMVVCATTLKVGFGASVGESLADAHGNKHKARDYWVGSEIFHKRKVKRHL